VNGPFGGVPFGSYAGTDTLIAHWEQQRQRSARAALESTTGVFAPPTVYAEAADRAPQEQAQSAIQPVPEIVVGALVEQGDRVPDGRLIICVTPIFRRFVRELSRDPAALHRLNPRQMEELVAGAYDEEGCKVTLTPRSGDGGRDVIATSPVFGTVRILDQVKLLAPHRVVDADVVRALLGVLGKDLGASKGFVTTTTTFAPHIATEFADLIPGRITLRDGAELRKWLLPANEEK
jgi:restriction system protein